MRVKFAIAVCALLVLALGASHVQAQARGGYLVYTDPNKVVQYGANQTMGRLQFVYRDNAGVIDAGNTIMISYHGLTITNPVGTADAGVLGNALPPGEIDIVCTGFADVDCSDISVKALNEEDTKVGTVTLTLPVGTRTNSDSIYRERGQNRCFGSGRGRKDYGRHQCDRGGCGVHSPRRE